MKLVSEVALGALAAVVSYGVARAVLARPAPVEPASASVAAPPAAAAAPATGQAARAAGPAVAAPAEVSARAEPEDRREVQRRAEMAVLRNAVIRAATSDMGQRGASVTACLDGAQLAGEERLRFAVDVAATADRAELGAWRFVEVADGEPLPGSFAACAARAFGAGQRAAPPPGLRFPDFQGELVVLYTIPAP